MCPFWKHTSIMVVIWDPIGSVSVAEPLLLVTPCPVLAPTPELTHSPPSSSRGHFHGHHSPQRYLAALTLTESFTPHQGQPRKLMALLATTMQGEDEAMTTPVLKEPLYWTVSKGSQTETHSQARSSAAFPYRRRQVISRHMCKCLGKYQQECMNMPGSWQCLWAWDPTGKEAGWCPLSTQVGVTSGMLGTAPCLLLPGTQTIWDRSWANINSSFLSATEIGPVSISKSLIWCYGVGQNVLLFRPYCQSLLLLQQHDLVFGAT